MDETDRPQTPPELLIILAALADQDIPLQTIAPKFTGRFNKGVDYAGDVKQFEKEFNEDLCVIAFAIQQYGLPALAQAERAFGERQVFHHYGTDAPETRWRDSMTRGSTSRPRGRPWLGGGHRSWRKRAGTACKSRRRYTPGPAGNRTNFARRMPVSLTLTR